MVNPRDLDGNAEEEKEAAILRYRLHIKPSISQTHSILMPGQVVLALGLLVLQQVPGRVAVQVPCSSSAFLDMSLRFTILGEIFAYVTVFNPTNKVVTFCLQGFCILGVFLLPAFICLGHDCLDLLSRCNGMHVCTD